MSSGGWGCEHLTSDKCMLLKKLCHAGQNGCVLYGKATFVENNKFAEENENRKLKDRKELFEGVR